jgi:hypothetical protein
MSSGDGLMISGMGGTIPLIAMRGGNKQLGGVNGEQVSVGNSTIVMTPSGEQVTTGNSKIVVTPSDQNMSLRNSTTVVTPSGEQTPITTLSGENIGPSKITWEGTEYNISQTKDEWKEDDTNNFLNFLGIPKSVFSLDEQEYSDFIKGIRTCLNDSSSIDTTCNAVNNILRRVIELRIQELVEQKRYGNVQKVMNVISHKEDGSAPVAEEAETPESS